MEDVSATSGDALEKAFSTVGIPTEPDTPQQSSGDVIDRATEVWDKHLGDKVEREASKLDKHIADKEKSDPVFKAEREASRAKAETYSKVEAHLSDAVAEQAEWNETAELRRELEDLYPGKKPGEIVSLWLQLNENYLKDPAATADWHMRQLLAEQHIVPAKREAVAEDGSFDAAWQRADRNINERESWQEIIRYARQNKIGVREGLAQIIQHTKAGRTDPAYATARMAAQAGMPVTAEAQEFAALEQQKQQATQQIASNIHNDLQAMASDAAMAGLARPELQTLMAEIIEGPQFKTTGDTKHDIWNAYHMALHEENLRLATAQTEKTRAKANLSIVGGTPTGSDKGRSIPRSSGEALDRYVA